MKSIIAQSAAITAIILMCYSRSNGQCVVVTEGQKVTVVSRTFANTLPFTNKKWKKLKDEQRDELIAEFNAGVENGSTAPYSTVRSNFKVTAVDRTSPVNSYTIEEADGAYEYETTNYCLNDTMHLVRNADVVYSIYEGDTLGFAVQGVQRVPNNLKIGDKLPSFNDYMITIPKTWTADIKESVKDFSYTTTENKVGYMQDSYSGEFSYGKFSVTKRHDVYKTISHKVQITENIQNLSIHYYVAMVTGQEQLTVNGKTYDAFVIESESWSKGGLVRDYEAENQRIEAEQEAQFDKLMKKQTKFNIKSGWTNEEGYNVMYKKEWFIPGFGMARTEVHDAHGAIVTYADSEF